MSRVKVNVVRGELVVVEAVGLWVAEKCGLSVLLAYIPCSAVSMGKQSTLQGLDGSDLEL
jgi:hypothetical protein